MNLLYVGRLEIEKGVKELIKSIPYVAKRFPAIHLDVVGQGSLASELVTMARKLGVDKHISFVGQVSKKQTERYYKNAKLFIMPSLWPEPFGLVGLEAMSFGVPVIGSGSGGMDWLRNGKNGMVINPHKPKAIADAIGSLLDDEKVYTKLSRNATDELKERTLSHYTTQLTKLYQAVVAKSDRRSSTIV
jgi:glycosyltransferase involved in cell wall biosynthesis